jgi:hypothetical protein
MAPGELAHWSSDAFAETSLEVTVTLGDAGFRKSLMGVFIESYQKLKKAEIDSAALALLSALIPPSFNRCYEDCKMRNCHVNEKPTAFLKHSF